VIRLPLAQEDDFLSRIASTCESLYPTPKVLILNYPHNPTGALATTELFREVVRLARKYRFMVVQDFAYARSRSTATRHPASSRFPEPEKSGGIRILFQVL